MARNQINLNDPRLSPLAKRFFELWWNSAGMGEIDDVMFAFDVVTQEGVSDEALVRDWAKPSWKKQLRPLLRTAAGPVGAVRPFAAFN